MRRFNWLIILLGFVVAIGYGFTPAYAQGDVDADGLPLIGEQADSLEGIAPEAGSGGEEAITDGAFGRRDQVTWVPSWAFEATDGSTAFKSFDPAWRYADSGNGIFAAPVNLPSGARISQVRWYFYDNCAAFNALLQFQRENFPTGRTTLISGNCGISGYNYCFANPNHTVTNANNWYQIRIDVPTSCGNTIRFWGARFTWNRQIRTGLGHPFVDIGFLPAEFQNSIAALYQSGITTGTTPTTFSPSAGLTRAQMAVFLARALGLHWDLASGY